MNAPSETPAPTALPRLLLFGVAILEVIILVAATVMFTITLVREKAEFFTVAVALLLMLLIALAAAVAAVVGLWRRQRWVLGLMVVGFAIQGAVAAWLIQSGQAYAWGLAALSLVGIILAFLPAVTRELR